MCHANKRSTTRRVVWQSSFEFCVPLAFQTNPVVWCCLTNACKSVNTWIQARTQSTWFLSLNNWHKLKCLCICLNWLIIYFFKKLLVFPVFQDSIRVELASIIHLFDVGSRSGSHGDPSQCGNAFADGAQMIKQRRRAILLSKRLDSLNGLRRRRQQFDQICFDRRFGTRCHNQKVTLISARNQREGEKNQNQHSSTLSRDIACHVEKEKKNRNSFC